MLRYAAEFFGSLWPGQSMKRYVAALKDLQQALGTLHDTAVAPALSARLKAADGAMDALGKSLMEDWLAKDQRLVQRSPGGILAEANAGGRISLRITVD